MAEPDNTPNPHEPDAVIARWVDEAAAVLGSGFTEERCAEYVQRHHGAELRAMCRWDAEFCGQMAEIGASMVFYQLAAAGTITDQPPDEAAAMVVAELKRQARSRGS
jgi:hypothetical protein